MYSGRSFGFIGSSFFTISWCSLFWLSINCIYLFLNDISWCCVLQFFRHLVNHIVSMFQFTSRLCLTSQSYPKNIFMLFRSITATSICFLYSFILTSNSAYHVASLFLVLSILKTSNNWSIGFILIFSSFTSCLLILVCIYSEPTSIYSYNFFPFAVLILVCMLSSLSLLFL